MNKLDMVSWSSRSSRSSVQGTPPGSPATPVMSQGSYYECEPKKRHRHYYTFQKRFNLMILDLRLVTYRTYT